MNLRFSTTVCLLMGLLIINGILLSKFVQRYLVNAQKEFFNKTSEAKLFGESKFSLPEIDQDLNNLQLSDENGSIRLKRSIESLSSESKSANANTSKFSITELQKPPPDQGKYFAWNLNLNVSNYGNNFISPKKPAGQIQTDAQNPNNYLNMSLHLEGGGNRNYEALDSVWASVGNFIRQLFQNESSTMVPNDFDKNEDHQIDSKKLNTDEISEGKDEILGSFSSQTTHSELPKIPDKSEEILNSSTVSLEENDEDLAAKRKGGKFLFDLFGFGGPQSPKPSTEVDVGSGMLRSGPDVSDFISSSEQFADVSEVGNDTEHLSFIEPENINLTNALISGVTEVPSEEKLPTQSSPDNDSFQNLPNPTASVEANTNTDISFMMQDISHEKVCSDCDSKDETTHHSVAGTKSKTMREVAVFDLNIPQVHETGKKSFSTEEKSLQSENNISIELLNKDSDKIDFVPQTSTELDLKQPHHLSEFQSKFQIKTREDLCAGCTNDTFLKLTVDNDVQGQTSKIVTETTTMREVAGFDLNIPKEHDIGNKSLSTEVTSLQSEDDISIELFNKNSDTTDFVPQTTTELDLNQQHHLSEFQSKFQIKTREDLCAGCTTDSFKEITVNNDAQGQTSKTDSELNPKSSNIAQQHNETQKISNSNLCLECTTSENAPFSSEMERITPQNITATNLTEADLEKHCMKLIDVLANARNAITELSGSNSTVNQLNESQMELFKFLTNLISYILANQNPSTESIAAAENTTAHDLTLNETESNQLRVFSFDLGATAEKFQTESSIAEPQEVATEIPNSAFVAECDAFIRKKQMKENNKMFSKPNLMDIISDPNIRLHDFANATISPKLKEQQLQFLTDLLRGTKKEPSSTAETATEMPFVVEDEPNSQLSSSINIEGGTEEILLEEFNQDQPNADNETLTELLNGEDKERLFLGSILNIIGLGSGERSINEIENSSNETEFQDVIDESEVSHDETEMKENDERIFNSFEFASSTDQEIGLHSEIEASALVSTDEIATDENKGRFFFGILGLDGSGGGRDLVQTDDFQTETIENKIELSDTSILSTFDCEGDCAEPLDSIKARTIPIDIENHEGVTFENETSLSIENVDSECLEDCNLERKLGIKVNVHESSPTSDRNSTDVLDETLTAQNPNNADYECENDCDNHIEHSDSTSTEMGSEDIDARNFQDLYESSLSESQTLKINFSTPTSEGFESRITKSKFVDEFGRVGSFSNNITEDGDKIIPLPDPRSPKRTGRLDDPFDPLLISRRQPKRVDVENEFKFRTSPISEDGSWIDPSPKNDFPLKTELQTEPSETLTGDVMQVSELHSSTQVSSSEISRKRFQIFRTSTTEPSSRTCKSASECNVYLNERCITIDKISVCDCGRSFFRNEESGICEEKILVETSVRLPGEVYTDELNDVTTVRYKKMKKDSIQMMWYLLKENPDLFKMVADVDVLGFSPGSIVIHWSIILHPTTNSSLRKIHEQVETHLNETFQKEFLIQSAPLDFRSAQLISLPMMDPCQNREFNYCSENAVCQLTDNDGGYTCECDMNMVDKSVNKNYTGEICEEKCPNDFCGPHGVCQWQNNRRLCLCSSYYFGEKCESSAVVWVAVSSVMCVLMMMVVNTLMYVCRRIAKKLKRSRSGTSSRRLDEVIALDDAPVRPQGYAGIASPRIGPPIVVTAASDSIISFDGDSTFDTTHSDCFAAEAGVTAMGHTFTV